MGKPGRGARNMMMASCTRAGTTYQPSDVAKEDAPKVPVNLVRSIFADALTIDPLKMEKSTAQLSTNTNAAQAVADAAAEEAAAGVSHDLHAAAKKAAANAAAPERVAAEAAATVNNMHGEIKHLQLLLATERAIFHAAPESAIAVQAVIDPFKRVAINADAEAAATINNLKTRAWQSLPRRTRRAPGSPAPTDTGTSTQHPTTANPREKPASRQEHLLPQAATALPLPLSLRLAMSHPRLSPL